MEDGKVFRERTLFRHREHYQKCVGELHRQKDALTSGDRSDRASGIGSIMRLAPVPIRFVTFTESDEACTRVACENVAKFARVNAMV
jgi:hypothetical protein